MGERQVHEPCCDVSSSLEYRHRNDDFLALCRGCCFEARLLAASMGYSIHNRWDLPSRLWRDHRMAFIHNIRMKSANQRPDFTARRLAEKSAVTFGEQMMMPKDDWRRPGGEFLHGVPLVHRKYRQNQKNPKWDHDHCEFCGVTFSLMDIPEDLKEGYATEDDYRWVCPKCFEDFRDEFKWVVIEEMK